jgi:hypothetical protein
MRAWRPGDDHDRAAGFCARDKRCAWRKHLRHHGLGGKGSGVQADLDHHGTNFGDNYGCTDCR